MKAISVHEFGDPSVLQLRRIPIPIPTNGKCVVKILACGVNPVDTYIRSGKYPKLPSLPYTPGKDGAGIVHSVGDNVTNVTVGDRVYIFGAQSGSYAQYTLCNSDNVFSLPGHVSYEKGACLGTPAFTAYRALFEKGKGKSGETVFIHGASGGVGLAAIQLAKASGLKVVGTAGTQSGLDTILESGASHAYNHNNSSYLQQIQTDYPSGFDLCLEMLASSNLKSDFQLMGRGGRIAIIGNRGEIMINPRDIMSKELLVYGVALLSSSGEELQRAERYITRCLQEGKLDPLISMRYPLEEAEIAHKEIIERKNLKIGNIVLIPGE